MVGQLSLALAARAARDHALTAVLVKAGPSWVDQGIAALSLYAEAHEAFIGEEFREWALSSGLPAPHHHNAWGALLNVAAKQGVVRITNETRQMRGPKSHARRSPVWTSLRYRGAA